VSPRPFSPSLAAIVALGAGIFVAANAFAMRALLHREPAARAPAAARVRPHLPASVVAAGPRRDTVHTAQPLAPASGKVAAAAAETIPAAPTAPVARFAGPRIMLTEDPLRVHAAPREFQIVTVRVPESLAADSSVRYEIRPTGTATILGPLRGIVGAARDGARTLVFTVSVPAHALAGRRLIAQIDFVAGAVTVTLPVELVVEQVYGAAIAFRQQMMGVRRGDEVTLHYLLTNDGNGPDTFLVALGVPTTWHGPSVTTPVPVAAGGTTEGGATLYVPRTWGTGLASVHLIAYGPGGVERARGTTDVEVIDPAAQAGAQGPELTAGAATAFSDTGVGSSAVGFTLFGSVAPNTFVSGRLALATRSGSDVAALGRVGYFVGNPYLTVTAPTWQGTIGTAGRSFTPATGMDLWGSGGAFSWHGPRFDAAAFAAQPQNVGGGHLAGVQVGAKVAAGWIELTGTDLEDNAGAGRRLSAVGLSGSGPAPFGATASGELAYRSYAGGSGLGVSGEIERRTRTDYLDLRFRDTPGGTAAFARAKTEVSGTASRAVGDRLWLSGGLWSTSDRNPVFSRLSGWGGSFTPQLTLTPKTTLTGDVSYTSTNAASAAGTFGFAQGRARVGVAQTFGTLYAGASAGIGMLHQMVSVPSGASNNATAGQQTLTGRVGAALERVTVEMTAQYDHTGAGVGYLPSQLMLGAHAERLAVLSGAHSPLLSLALDRTTWFGMRQGVTTARAGLTAELPWDMALTVQVERNGFVTSGAGAIPWLGAVKLEHRLSVPLSFGATAARGVVYVDLNANGQRDHGEPGISSVVVRRGGEVVVTDRGGEFRFAQAAGAAPQVDETSLPFGLVVNATAPGRIGRGNRFEIAVTPTADVEVDLVPTAGPDGRLPRVDLTGSVIHIRDQAGNYWSARADSTGRAVFHALPPGQYTPELDLTGLSEPLRPGTAPTPFIVAPGHPVPRIVIPVYPRPVRLFDPSNPGHGAHSPGAAAASPTMQRPGGP
jgi:hypothetical protein